MNNLFSLSCDCSWQALWDRGGGNWSFDWRKGRDTAKHFDCKKLDNAYLDNLGCYLKILARTAQLIVNFFFYCYTGKSRLNPCHTNTFDTKYLGKTHLN